MAEIWYFPNFALNEYFLLLCSHLCKSQILQYSSKSTQNIDTYFKWSYKMNVDILFDRDQLVFNQC